MSDFSVFGGLAARSAYVEQVRENSGRLARAHGTWTSTGSGELIVPTAFNFGVTFLAEPAISYGFSMPEVDGVQQQLIAGSIPRCGGGVYAWVRDKNGFYTGCNVFFTIDFGLAGVPRSYTITHSMAFTATAMKDLPRAVLENPGVSP